MPVDLATQIRDLIDAVEPVSADEATRRAPGHPDGTVARRVAWVMPRAPRWDRVRPIGVLASGAVLVAGAATASALISTGTSSHPPHGAAGATTPVTVLSADDIRAIVAGSQAAAADSGTALVHQSTSQNGTAQADYAIAVTFDGANVDEKITSTPQPAGSSKTFSTDDRLVDGQFYIYTAGPGGVVEWMHDTDSANDVASMQVPDPRTLYGALDAKARLEVVQEGAGENGGLTHLRALDPSAIDGSALGSLVNGTVSSFEMWIDASNVVQKMAFTSSSTVQGCAFHVGSGALKALRSELNTEHLVAPEGGSVSSPAFRAAVRAAGISPTCGPQTTTSVVTASFADLGAPERVVAPPGAVDFEGKG